MHGLENKYSSQVQFTYIDVDDGASSDLKSALNYRYQPHIFLLDGDGTVLRQWVGFASGEDVEIAIQDVLFP